MGITVEYMLHTVAMMGVDVDIQNSIKLLLGPGWQELDR